MQVNYAKVQNSDDVPEGLTPGQISIGVSKGYYCTGDGEVREFGKGGGGVPVYGKDFEWSGDASTYLVLDDGDNNWRIKFLTSGIFKPLTNMIIDTFLVGAGGGGGQYITYEAGGGGGGGYTKTSNGIVLTSGIEYNIIVGLGGAGGELYKNGNEGGISSAFNISINGGKGGYASGTGGAGGSGGGAGGYAKKSTTTSKNAGIGGSNGSNGEAGRSSGGIGQGTTTREFGEETGDLYSGGGGGGYSYDNGYHGYPANGGEGGGGNGGGYSASDNTGGGGGGGYHVNSDKNGGDGGSGIIIIRNHRE